MNLYTASQYADITAPDATDMIILPSVIERKAGDAGKPPTYDFVFSSARPDRMGDVIEQDFDMRAYRQNPIILFNHMRNAPIGQSLKAGVSEGKLRGRIQFAEDGTDELADKVRKLVDQDILRATSVGILPTEMEARKDAKGNFLGVRIMKSILLEVSVVSLPANPDALLEAKRKGLDCDLIQRGMGDLVAFRAYQPVGSTSNRNASVDEPEVTRATSPRARAVLLHETQKVRLRAMGVI